MHSTKGYCRCPHAGPSSASPHASAPHLVLGFARGVPLVVHGVHRTHRDGDLKQGAAQEETAARQKSRLPFCLKCASLLPLPSLPDLLVDEEGVHLRAALWVALHGPGLKGNGQLLAAQPAHAGSAHGRGEQGQCTCGSDQMVAHTNGQKQPGLTGPISCDSTFILNASPSAFPRACCPHMMLSDRSPRCSRSSLGVRRLRSSLMAIFRQ